MEYDRALQACNTANVSCWETLPGSFSDPTTSEITPKTNITEQGAGVLAGCLIHPPRDFIRSSFSSHELVPSPLEHLALF
jgi:hypothetical protein